MRGCRITQVVALAECLVFFLAISMAAEWPSSPLKVGFYQETCPFAEVIVSQTVAKAVARDPGFMTASSRYRLTSIITKGCDGSVLLDSLPGVPSEKESPANVRAIGFEVIDEAKAKLEAKCPNTVSCAHVLAFAARDSVYYLGSIAYAVPSGRRDGRVSKASEANAALPPPFFNVSQLKESFAKKGLSVEELVTLSGAHSIGVAHCSSFRQQALLLQCHSSMNNNFAAQLMAKCPQRSSGDGTVLLDFVTPNQLDNVYYRNLLAGEGVLTSDQTLLSDLWTAKMVRDNWYNSREWAAKFANAMVHLGSIDVLTGNKGEIRKYCRVAK